MEPLISQPQLTNRLRLSSIDNEQAQLVIANASGMVRGIARQEFSFVAQETVLLVGGERVLRLPQRPVVVDGANPLTVVEVGDFGEPDQPVTENVDYLRVGAELTRGYPSWFASRLQGWPYFRQLGVWSPRVRVTYSHGYPTIPDELVSITLDVAQALYSNPSALRSLSIGSYSETYATELLGTATVEALRARLSAVGARRSAFSIHQT